MSSQFFRRDLIDKYNLSGPRYTSYPTAVEFHTQFGAADYVAGIKHSDASKPLSIYIHVPFCDTLCYYCACNKIITKDHSRADAFLANLMSEMALVAPLVKNRPVVQMHWGGGTPTFLSDAQIAAIIQHLHDHFTMLTDDQGEYGIEIDPRAASPERIRNLRQLGFNRISLGVQDINPKVQQAVHRIQPTEVTAAVLNAARDCGFQSTSLDLIYGLPFQSRASFSATLDQVIEWRPDRLSVFNYAHLPHLFMPQKRIRPQDLPSAEEKLEILEGSIDQLTTAGYEFIGMDHFALPEDELAQAQKNASLHRNFQGYTTHGECDLLGFGPSAISQIGDVYSQNVKTLEDYYPPLNTGQLPVWRGRQLDQDDRIRRAAIVALICQFTLDKTLFSQIWHIDFDTYFEPELKEFAQMSAEGLLTLSAERIDIGPAGRLLIRNICMKFDKYLQRMQREVSFSRTI